MDVIVGSSSSDILKEAILNAGGMATRNDHQRHYALDPNAPLISTVPGNLHCKKVFFLKWQPTSDDSALRQSIVDLVSNVIHNVIMSDYKSIAFPAIGCGNHGCSIAVVVETFVKAVKEELRSRKPQLTVKFVIQPDKQNIYNEFCKHLLASDNGKIDNFSVFLILDLVMSLYRKETKSS